MAFIVTGLYVLALFSAGVVFVRRGQKERRDKKEDHGSAASPAWEGANRRATVDRRSGAERRRQDAVLTCPES